MSRPHRTLNDGEKSLAVKLALNGRTPFYIATQFGIKPEGIIFNCDNDKVFGKALYDCYGESGKGMVQASGQNKSRRGRLKILRDDEFNIVWKTIRQETDDLLSGWKAA